MSYYFFPTEGWAGSHSEVTAGFAFTFSCWVRPTTTGGTVRTAISFGDNSSSTHYALLGIDTTQKAWAYSESGRRSTSTLGTTTLSSNTWYHFCALFTGVGGYQDIWLNGTQENSSASTYFSTALDTVGIGLVRAGATNSNGMYGYLARAAIWKSSLTSGEIGALAAGVSPTQVSPSTMCWYLPLINTNQIIMGTGSTTLVTYGTPTGNYTGPIELMEPSGDQLYQPGAKTCYGELDFETGDTSEFDSDFGTPDITTAAGLNGSVYGLEMDPTTAQYVQKNESGLPYRITVRFYLDTNSFTETSFAYMPVFDALVSGTTFFTFYLFNDGGDYGYRVGANEGGPFYTEWLSNDVYITDGLARYEITLGMSDDGSNDVGFMLVRVDGSLQVEKYGLDNGYTTNMVNQFRFGVLSAAAGYGGTIYLDDIKICEGTREIGAPTARRILPDAVNLDIDPQAPGLAIDALPGAVALNLAPQAPDRLIGLDVGAVGLTLAPQAAVGYLNKVARPDPLVIEIVKFLPTTTLGIRSTPDAVGINLLPQAVTVAGAVIVTPGVVNIGLSPQDVQLAIQLEVGAAGVTLAPQPITIDEAVTVSPAPVTIEIVKNLPAVSLSVTSAPAVVPLAIAPQAVTTASGIIVTPNAVSLNVSPQAPQREIGLDVGSVGLTLSPQLATPGAGGAVTVVPINLAVQDVQVALNLEVGAESISFAVQAVTLLKTIDVAPDPVAMQLLTQDVTRVVTVKPAAVALNLQPEAVTREVISTPDVVALTLALPDPIISPVNVFPAAVALSIEVQPAEGVKTTMATGDGPTLFKERSAAAFNYTIRYVSSSAGGGGDGLTEGNAWTMAEANTNAAANMMIMVIDDGIYTTGIAPTASGSTTGMIVFAGKSPAGGGETNGGRPRIAPASGYAADLNALTFLEFLDLQGGAGASDYGVFVGGSDCGLHNCIVHDSGSTGVYSSSASFRTKVRFCHIYDNDGAGTGGLGAIEVFACQIHGNTNQGIEGARTVLFSEVYSNGSHGVDLTRNNGLVAFNTIYDNGGNGYGRASGNDGAIVSIGNIYSNNSAFGIDVGTQSPRICVSLADHFYNNTSGEYAVGGVATTDLPNVGKTTGDPLFTNLTVGSEDFTLQAGSPAAGHQFGTPLTTGTVCFNKGPTIGNNPCMQVPIPDLFGGATGSIYNYQVRWVSTTGDAGNSGTSAGDAWDLETALTAAISAPYLILVQDDGTYNAPVGGYTALGAGSSSTGMKVVAGTDNQSGANSNGGRPIISCTENVAILSGGDYTHFENLEFVGSAAAGANNRAQHTGSPCRTWNCLARDTGGDGITHVDTSESGLAIFCAADDVNLTGIDGGMAKLFCRSSASPASGLDTFRCPVHFCCEAYNGGLYGYRGTDGHTTLFCLADGQATGLRYWSTGEDICTPGGNLISNHTSFGVDSVNSKAYNLLSNVFYNNTTDLDDSANMPQFATQTGTDPGYTSTTPGSEDYSFANTSIAYEYVDWPTPLTSGNLVTNAGPTNPAEAMAEPPIFDFTNDQSAVTVVRRRALLRGLQLGFEHLLLIPQPAPGAGATYYNRIVTDRRR